jgi:hypothetical protein
MRRKHSYRNHMDLVQRDFGGEQRRTRAVKPLGLPKGESRDKSRDARFSPGRGARSRKRRKHSHLSKDHLTM